MQNNCVAFSVDLFSKNLDGKTLLDLYATGNDLCRHATVSEMSTPRTEQPMKLIDSAADVCTERSPIIVVYEQQTNEIKGHRKHTASVSTLTANCQSSVDLSMVSGHTLNYPDDTIKDPAFEDVNYDVNKQLQLTNLEDSLEPPSRSRDTSPTFDTNEYITSSLISLLQRLRSKQETPDNSEMTTESGRTQETNIGDHDRHQKMMSQVLVSDYQIDSHNSSQTDAENVLELQQLAESDVTRKRQSRGNNEAPEDGDACLAGEELVEKDLVVKSEKEYCSDSPTGGATLFRYLTLSSDNNMENKYLPEVDI